jgi:hypothetical protein
MNCRKMTVTVSLSIFWLLVLGLSACNSGTSTDGGVPCSVDEECGIGEYCHAGVCTPFGGDKGPQSCSTDTECKSGEICNEGVCVPGEHQDGGDDGGDFSSDGDAVGTDTVVAEPQITLAGDVITHQDEHGTLYEINFGSATVGVPVDANLVVRNTGGADLELSVVTLTDDPQQEFVMAPTVPPSVILAPGEEQSLLLTYTAKDGLTDRAVAKIFSNDPDEGQLDVQLISEFKGEAMIHLDPVLLQFGAVPSGQPATLPLTISNMGTGNAVLRLDSVEPEVGISTAYTVAIEDPDQVTQLTPPVFINRGDFVLAQVTFLAPGRGSFDGNLIVTSSDQAASPASVAMTASAGVPEITIEPAAIDFGNVAVNDSSTVDLIIRNDGVGNLSVPLIDLAAGSSTDFSLENLPAPLPAQPLTLAPSSQASVTVRYSPGDVANDMGTLLIDHDDPEPGQEAQVLVTGNGFQGNEPPTAVILANAADTAVLDAMLGEQIILDGTTSFDDGSISAYLWEIIEQPAVQMCGTPLTLPGASNNVTSIILSEAGLVRVGLTVTDNDGADSPQDMLDIIVHAGPEAKIKQGGNDTGYLAIDMGTEVTFDATTSSDCDGAVVGYDWQFIEYPPGRGSPPPIGGGGLYATVMFDFPGDYKIGLVVGDNDVPQNSSDQATFDIHVRGPKSFRVTLDWYEQAPNNRKVDVDLHLLKPGSSNTFSPDDCCPTKDDGCEQQVNWGTYGSPTYQTDNWEDPDGALWPSPGNFGDEIDFNNPGMGNYAIYVYFRCHSSANMSTYICCDDTLPPCPFSPWCNDSCDRAAAGIVRFFVTGYDDQETEVTQKTFAFAHGQVLTFFQVGTINWPNGTLQ